jgi:hypothetical protein
MIVSILDVSACCPSCGGMEFRQLDPGAVRLATRMACRKCHRSTTYRELLESIGEEAMRRANEAIAKLKKNSPRRRKSRK